MKIRFYMDLAQLFGDHLELEIEKNLVLGDFIEMLIEFILTAIKNGRPLSWGDPVETDAILDLFPHMHGG